MSNSTELQWGGYGGAPCCDFTVPKTQADSVITPPLSQPCWAPWLLLSLHFHSKYTDHGARLRKQSLCILADGIYSERVTYLLYLVVDGWGSRRNRGLRRSDQSKDGWSAAWRSLFPLSVAPSPAHSVLWLASAAHFAWFCFRPERLIFISNPTGVALD